MKTLVLLRHAKAVKDDPDGDHARSLNAAGREAATAAGERLRPLLPLGVLIAASDARRTRETALHAFPDLAQAVRLEPSAYAAAPETLLDLIRDFPAEAPAAVLVGHNPGLSELAAVLAGHGDAQHVARLAHGMATADAVVFEVADDWRGVKPGSGRVMAFLARKGEED